MREPNKANCIESVGGITTSMGHKLVIRDVTHYSEKECTSSGNEESYRFLFRRVVVEIIAMKKAYKKSVSALMNLI